MEMSTFVWDGVGTVTTMILNWFPDTISALLFGIIDSRIRNISGFWIVPKLFFSVNSIVGVWSSSIIELVSEDTLFVSFHSQSFLRVGEYPCLIRIFVLRTLCENLSAMESITIWKLLVLDVCSIEKRDPRLKMQRGLKMWVDEQRMFLSEIELWLKIELNLSGIPPRENRTLSTRLWQKKRLKVSHICDARMWNIWMICKLRNSITFSLYHKKTSESKVDD